MADNSLVPVDGGSETFANKDIAGVKYPKHIPVDSTGAEIVPATAAQIGEVQASPTANTVLDRLKAIATALAGTLTVATHAVTQSGSWVLSAGSALIGKVGIDQTTDGTTNKVAADLRVAGSAVATGAGASGSTVPRVTLASDSPGVISFGQTTMSASIPVAVASDQGAFPVTIKDISNGEYETVAASQTDQVLGATGAAGDWLEGVLIIPAAAAAGAVSIKDGSGSSITIFAGGGTTALPTLAPIYVPLGIKSTGGAWKVTTGANVSAIGIGNFT